MGLDMYVFKINKKVNNDKELNLLCSLDGKIERIYKHKEMINENRINDLVKDVFIESFYDDYIKFKDASEEILNMPYERKFNYHKGLSNRDRLTYIEKEIKEHIEEINYQYDYCTKNKDIVNSLKQTDLGYFRKHADLHGYFEELYFKRGGTKEFNCVKLILTLDDIKNVIEIANNQLKGIQAIEKAEGFFWGESNDYWWKETKRIFEEILETTNFEEETVFYDSWW